MHQSIVELVDSLQNSCQAMVAQLHQFCEINSGTNNLDGLKMMHQALQSTFIPIADEINSRKLPDSSHVGMDGEITCRSFGDALFVQKRPNLKRRILLCGHMDTVYDSTHPFQQLKYIDDNHLNGPGVTDMKGGLVVMLHALNAFERTPFAHSLGWDVFINSEEEFGSPSSSTFIEEISKNYQAALVYEPAMNQKGNLAKNRKGSGKFTLVATGRAAHAGRDFYSGRNAICYLAEIITAINALNGQREGVTINVGKISGGMALNVVPDRAVVKLDVRINFAEDAAWVQQQINTISDQFKRIDYSLFVHGGFGRPVKRVNQATENLFARIQELGRELEITLDWTDSGGCCDGNNLALHGLPVIDTLGVRGDNIHTANEYVVLDSLVERAALSALLLVDLAQGGLEKL
jgi:glutamate carboxypeptidase